MSEQDLCDTCIIKNCTAGHVVYGDLPVMMCASWKRMVKVSNKLPPQIDGEYESTIVSLCITCDRKYCTRRGFITEPCEAHVVKLSALPQSICKDCTYRKTCVNVWKLHKCEGYIKEYSLNA